jgi:HAD superfamily hydrolase (TIGR01549 family)
MADRTSAIIDVDGTLIDTNYQHALAWYRAFRASGLVLPLWRIHRHIGMGGDQMVEALGGAELEERYGDEVRAAEGEAYGQMVDEVEPLEGSRELLAELRRRGVSVVLASSAKPEELEHYLDLLDARGLADAWTDSGDVEATKPEPDLVLAALDKAGGGEAVMIGDSVWDCRAAANAGIESIGVLTGGFSEQELREAGASAVYHSVDELRERLDECGFAGGD